MADKRDYYEVLGIGRDSSGDDVRGAFRKLAKEFHPDVNKTPGAEDRFKEINEAYAVLSDQEKRASYDRFGHAGVNGMPNNFDFSGFGINDIFEQFFGFGGGTRGRPNAPRRGADLRYDLNLTFEEAVHGVDKEIAFSRNETCSTCSGSGATPGTSAQTCATCRGAGEVRQTRQTILGSMVNVTTCPSCSGRGETIASPCGTCRGRGLEQVRISRVIPIPPGVDDGTRIRLSAEGEPGANGGPKGDLYVVTHVKPHRYFRRRGNDIILDLEINIAQAVLGAAVTIPTIDGDSSLRIPPGTASGAVLRVKSLGVPHLRRNGRGDQIVVISVEIPKSISNEQRELFARLAETMGTEALPQERGFLDRIRELLGGLAD